VCEDETAVHGLLMTGFCYGVGLVLFPVFMAVVFSFLLCEYDGYVLLVSYCVYDGFTCVVVCR
jgi:hypothetical protein